MSVLADIGPISHVGIYPTWSDSVDANGVFGQHGGQTFGEVDQSGFTCGVSDIVITSVIGVGASDVDDACSLLEVVSQRLN